MSFLGLFTFTAPYLPWVILGFGKLTPPPSPCACSCRASCVESSVWLRPRGLFGQA
jgi:hypothetical protein